MEKLIEFFLIGEKYEIRFNMQRKMGLLKQKGRQSNSLVQNCIILYEWEMQGVK